MPLPGESRRTACGGLEDHLRLLVENSPEGMVICDEGDRIVFANSRFCDLFGWEASEVAGKLIGEVTAGTPGFSS
ncbi:MAG: PAS domain-containing protein, partial [Thermovirgaceae bacterium]